MGISEEFGYHTSMQFLKALLSVSAFSILAVGCFAQRSEEEKAPAMVDIPEGMETAVVGAGCFWCVEVFFESLDGVHEVYSGYAGGTEVDPRYYDVALGKTSHVEVVQIIFDPEVIAYRELIDFFWTTHDATRGDGVWPDFGPHYRSILLYADKAQKAAIEASRKDYEARSGKAVATDIQKLNIFYPAETYHQDYAAKNPNDRYVRGVLNPKLKKLGLD